MIQNIQMTPAMPALPWPVLWAPVFSAAGVVLVGCVAAYIAWRQMVTARTKVQADLYALRYPVYQKARDVLQAAANCSLKTIQLSDFRTARATAAFLFDDGIVEFMGQVYAEIDAQDTTLNGYYDEDLGHVYGDPQDAQDSSGKLYNLIAEYDRRFLPYMRLEERSNTAFKTLYQTLTEIVVKAASPLT